MKLLAKLSMITFSLSTRLFLQINKKRLFGSLLKKSFKIMNPSDIANLKIFVINKITPSGGFQDMAGKADIYFTLFGYFICNSLKMKDNLNAISRYIDSEYDFNKYTGVNLYCQLILAKCLSGQNKDLLLKVNDRKLEISYSPVYDSFLKLICCLYIKDYTSLYIIKKQYMNDHDIENKPCSVLSAMLVIHYSFGYPVNEIREKLLTYYKDGGFFAMKNSIIPDILSTSVALFALNFTKSDIRIIRPMCLKYIDSLSCDGGFVSHWSDTESDIESTFYGLLALGVLSE